MSDFRLYVGRGIRLPRGIVGDSILVHNGVVAAVGDQVTVTRQLPPGVACPIERFDGFLVPGLRDSHLHPVAYTALLTGAPLNKVASIAELQDALQHVAATGSGLINGNNLNEATLAEKRLPLAADLDAVSIERPVMVQRYDGHLAIVNSVALQLAGIEDTTVDPEGGVIDRDESGKATGVLRETAIDLVASAPGIESPVAPSDVARHMRALAGLGITSIGAMVRSGDGPWAHLGDEAEILAAAASEIPIRVHAFVIADTLERLEPAAAVLDGASDRMDWAGVKRFGDGSFGSFTAAMFEPFCDHPSTGTMRLNELDVAMAHAAVAAGRAVAIHAIGDAAASKVLDVFEHLAEEGVEGHRLRIEHASVLQQSDIERMGRVGAVASVQPAFLGSETDWIEARVGTDRLKRTYAFRTLLDAGVLVVGGSDSPVESPDPWEAMALCRDRAGLVMDEALSAEESLALYTTAAARALGEAEPLALGSPADFIAVDRDPILATPDELRHTVVMATFVGGELVDVDPTVSTWID
ncbi:MAG: amidohydrolase [Acidimicrobiia bacterium]|nr:amidohydrolase [Acidimicrobiia bacterium]